jgi:hypothetical protein
LANWHLICTEKEFGELGIPGLRDLNLCLLGSWVNRFISDDGKLWRSIVGRKYCREDNIFYSESRHASPFWKGVMMAAKAVKLGYRWIPGNGKRIHFWEDTWFGSVPLAVQFWELYSICNEKTKTLAEVWVDKELRVTFRRTFSNQMMQKWDELVSVVEHVVLNEDVDALIWCYEKSGVYSSHSCYKIISYRGVTPVHIPAIWGVAVPPKNPVISMAFGI